MISLTLILGIRIVLHTTFAQWNKKTEIISKTFQQDGTANVDKTLPKLGRLRATLHFLDDPQHTVTELQIGDQVSVPMPTASAPVVVFKITGDGFLKRETHPKRLQVTIEAVNLKDLSNWELDSINQNGLVGGASGKGHPCFYLHQKNVISGVAK